MSWKMLQIFKQEIYLLASRRSFWFATLGVPLIGLAVFAIVTNINRSQGVDSAADPMSSITGAFAEEKDLRPQGFVDHSGLIPTTQAPASANDPEAITLTRFADEQQARAALDRGEISAYYVVPEDYLQSGTMFIYGEEFDLMSSDDQAGTIESMLNRGLLQNDDTAYWRFVAPLASLDAHNLSGDVKQGARVDDGGGSFFVPYTVMMLLYISLMSSSGMLLNSVSKEKENRVMEVLLLSTKPRELLMGKVLGLGVIGLLQVAMWGASGLILLRLGGQVFQLPAAFQLDPVFLLWMLAFFILGYLVYASLMAGVGALVPNLREASQATIYVALPLMIPLFLINALIESPNSPLTTILSIFPFTAPTTMMLRMAAADVPIWQVLISLALLAVTAVLVVRAVAGMFRAQSLLSGSPFKLKLFLRALLGRA